MTYVLMVKFTTKAGAEERAAEILADLQQPSQEEPGILSYVAHRDLDDPRVLVMYEVYETKDALPEHQGSAHFSSVGEELVGLMDSIEKYELEPLGS
jgi:quinol monooxygenase YgiN